MAILNYNKALIDALCDVVPAVKPQLAYYEMYGVEGIRTFMRRWTTRREKGMFVIADGKRNDIGTTMEASCHCPSGRGRGRGGKCLPPLAVML